jgi:hypothetical protein
MSEMGEQIIRQSHQQSQNNISLDELRELLELQAAIYAYVTYFEFPTKHLISGPYTIIVILPHRNSYDY